MLTTTKIFIFFNTIFHKIQPVFTFSAAKIFKLKTNKKARNLAVSNLLMY
jgi:hypothetical protein